MPRPSRRGCAPPGQARRRCAARARTAPGGRPARRVLMGRGTPPRRHPVKPSDVRARVLAEHLWLSEKITPLEAAAASGLAGSRSEVMALRERTRNLCESLWFHLATEDEILVPLLRELDAWGEVRVERVQGDHQAQREEIAELRREAEDADPPTLAQFVLAFSHALRADMAHEEEVSLSRELLRDDPVALDQLDG